MALQKLTTGQQDFINIRRDNAIYVDKTNFIYQLLNENNKSFFFSRPRRFGKSLLVNTLKEVFLGNKQYFQGLFIEDKIEWKKYPVLHFDFSRMGFQTIGLVAAIQDRLDKIGKEYQIEFQKTDYNRKFEELIHKLYEKTGEQIVILVDEYDKPITDALEAKSQIRYNEKAKEHRDILRAFYSVLKGNAAYIHFFFITGISRFGKMSLFSELNNLTDLTFRDEYNNICGCTKEEVAHYFTPHLERISQKKNLKIEDVWQKMKEWYNGYSWNGIERVYNPFSILCFLESGQFHNFWIDSGTPMFLIRMLKEQNKYNWTGTAVSMSVFNFYDIDNLNTETLLFQTGYLTVQEITDDERYILGYPNREVEEAILQYLMNAYTYDIQNSALSLNIKDAVKAHNLDYLVENINILFASIPAEIFIKNKESYYHSILYIAFRLCGFHITSEVRQSKGRLDAMMRYENKVYLFEFKLDESADAALQQIHEKGYYKSYQNQGLAIYLLGINFSSEQKEIQECKVEII